MNLGIRVNRNFLLYLIPAGVVIAVLLAVYLVKGIFPFGLLTVVYSDMAQGYIPFCYHIYDVFYHGKSLFWDPFVGTGSNMLGIEAFCGMFSPVTWLVLFSSREGIPYFASFLLMVRMALMATTSLVFINKVFKDTPSFWKVALSVMYAFSGYVLVQYTNMMWLDGAVLFPLLLLTLKNLLDRDKKVGFILVLFANLIICFYLSYMILLFLLFGSGIALIFYVNKERRKKALFGLVISIFFSIMATCFVVLPGYLQSSSSIRGSMVNYLDLLKKGIGPINNKWLIFAFAATGLVILVRMLMNFKKDKKAVTVFALLMGITMIQILVEATNLIWHTGSYVCFPMRYAFIPIFILLAAGAYYLSKNAISPFKSKTEKIGYVIIGIATYIIAVLLGFFLGRIINISMPPFGINDFLCVGVLSTTVLFAVSIWIFMKLKNPKMRYVLLSIVILTELFTHSMWYIGVPPDFSNGTELSISWVFEANQVKKDFDIKNDNFTRYKDVDGVFNSNYPLVIGAPAVSTYIHMISAKQQTAFKQMGYTTWYTRILDTGGTIFSDMILNVNNFMTKLNSNDAYTNDLFNLAGRSKDFYLYKNNYPLPYGQVFSSENAITTFQPDSSPFDNQNAMFKTLFNRKDNIIERFKEKPKYKNIKVTTDRSRKKIVLNKNKMGGEIQYSLKVKGEQYLYLSTTGFATPINILVNDLTLPIPSLGNIKNIKYPSGSNCGLINLGFFHDETVDVKLVIPRNNSFKNLQLGAISIAKLKNLSSSLSAVNNQPKLLGNNVSFDVTSNQTSNSFFIPINYDESWECKVNGINTPIEKIFGTFIKVNLNQGENKIELSFVPKGLNLGLIILGITLLLWLAGYFVSRKIHFWDNKILLNSVYFVFWPVYFGGVLIVYIVPLIALVIGYK